jgi:hypothetical protein
MKKPAYLINTETGAKFMYTDALSVVPGMAPCDKDGKVMANGAGVQPPAPPVSKGDKGDKEPEVLTLEDYKVLLEKMERAELEAKAVELDVEFAPNIGSPKLIERVLAVIAERLEAAKGGE